MSGFSMGEMLGMQRALQERYKDRWEAIGPEAGKHKLLWMVGEIGEVADIIKKNGETRALDYFISSLASAEGDINAFRPSTGTMQTGFDLKRVSSWGGLVNLPVYLVHFTTFNTIDKITVE